MEPLIEHLLRPEAYDHPVERFEVLQTHVSWVILTGPFAYKIKKPVRFGFVDFSTLELRRACCEEELRLNRRLAGDLYVAVRPIAGPIEAPSFVPSGSNRPDEPIEYAVQMRQFPQASLLPSVLERGELTGGHIDELADTLAQFHEGIGRATPDDPYGDPAVLREQMEDNVTVLRASEDADWPAFLGSWIDRESGRLADWFLQRKRDGRVRECHGDLHLGNMLLRNDRIEMFDCLEFNPALRWIDIVDEIAFLAMDLTERGRPDFASRVLNRWLEQTGNYDGLTGWRWYFAYRALVRAKVTALRLAQEKGASPSSAQVALHGDLQRYLDLAAEQSRSRPTPVIITHGVSGTGKSHLTTRLCERIGLIRVRSDVERKRLFGQWGTTDTEVRAGDPYRSEVTEELYSEVLPRLGETILAAGFPLIFDATFLKRGHREALRKLARSAGVPFVILDIVVDRELARSRIVERTAKGGDPSDANLAILDRQLAADEPLSDDERSNAVTIHGPDPEIDPILRFILGNASSGTQRQAGSDRST